MAKPYLKFDTYVTTPYVTESIVAQQSDDIITSSMPNSATMMWDVVVASKNTNGSLSGAEFTSQGKIQEQNILTVPSTHIPYEVIAGSILLSAANIPVLSSYCITTFDFVSAGALVLSMTGDYSNDMILTNATGYPTATGLLLRSTGGFSITPSICLSASVLSAVYIGDYGIYIPSTWVNTASANILTIDMQTINYMYRISGDLSTDDIRNGESPSYINLSAFEYFPQHPSNWGLEFYYFNNEPEIRSAYFKLVNTVSGQEGPYPEYYNGLFQLDYPSQVSAVATSDSPSSWGWFKEYLLQTNTYSPASRIGNDYTITLNVSNYNDGVKEDAFSRTFTIDEFPDTASFSSSFLVANNAPTAVGVDNGDGTYSQKLWRDLSQLTVSAAATFQILGWDSSQGTIGINWGDGYISGFGSLSAESMHTYSYVSPATARAFAFAHSVSATNWLSAHSTTDSVNYMDIDFVERFLSGNFIAYPQYYFDINGDYHLLTKTNYTESQGVSAYGEGSYLVINLSAAEPELGQNTKYQWGITYVDDLSGGASYSAIISATEGSREDVYDFGSTYSYTQGGSALSLTVFNDTFPINMNPWYYNDAGVLVKYPNFDSQSYAHTTSADNSNVLFQNVRVFQYEDPIYTLDAIDQVADNSGITVASVLDISFPDYSPVGITDGEYVWTLSSAGWSDVIEETNTSPNFSYKITKGNGVTPGTIQLGDTIVISIGVSALNTIDIEERDFNPKLVSSNVSPVTASILGEFESPLRIYTNTLHAITGETIYFQNITNGTLAGDYIYEYIWDLGDGTAPKTVLASDSSLISASYSSAGTYSISLTANSYEDSVSVRTFSNIITVEPYYVPFNSDVIRVYGSSQIEYPHSFSDIMVKPNEWAVADNINAAFYKLNDDLEYLQAASKKYREPPTKLYGWLGQSKYNETDISWHINIAGINGQYASTENAVDNSRGLNDLRGISVYDDNLYAATKTTVYILSSDYEATELGSRTIKTIGDPFFDIRAIGVNSDGQIYVLDNTVQRVAVFDSYANSGWKFLYGWGKYGGPSTFKGFKDPVDLHIDFNDNVWITDAGNNVVKKYTKSGSWLQTIRNTRLTVLKSTAIDVSGNIHVLTSNGVIKFDPSGEYISTYFVVPSDLTPKKIVSGRDGFLYIICTAGIVKVTYGGIYGGTFGNTLHNINFCGGYQDADRNLYITNYNNIVKYYDTNTIDSVTEESSVMPWSMDEIYIHKDEYVQDWVYNKAFARLWDNIEIVKRSMTGTIYEATDAQGNVRNIILGFTRTQYNALFSTTKKEDIFIGINEIVTADSINRCLRMLFDILDQLLAIVSSKQLDLADNDDITIPTELIQGLGWRWTDIATWGINPFTWEQIGTRGFYPTKWECAVTGKICDN